MGVCMCVCGFVINFCDCVCERVCVCDFKSFMGLNVRMFNCVRVCICVVCVCMCLCVCVLIDLTLSACNGM